VCVCVCVVSVQCVLKHDLHYYIYSETIHYATEKLGADIFTSYEQLSFVLFSDSLQFIILRNRGHYVGELIWLPRNVSVM
jgi:hypothetical protein